MIAVFFEFINPNESSTTIPIRLKPKMATNYKLVVIAYFCKPFTIKSKIAYSILDNYFSPFLSLTSFFCFV